MKKENFIFVKKLSIPTPVLQDIISNFDSFKLYFNNILLFNNNNNNSLKIKNFLTKEIKVNLYKYVKNINDSVDFLRTVDVAIDNLKIGETYGNDRIHEYSNLESSKESINLITDKPLLQTHSVQKKIENNKFKIINNSDLDNISDFKFLKDTGDGTINDQPIFPEKRIERLYDSKQLIAKEKKIFFIWFLNDYVGEIIFWNDFHIKPTPGMLLIFPSSWCFPYSEFIENGQTKYTISGYVYTFHSE